MKRYIKCATTSDYEITINTVFDIDELDLKNQIMNICEPAEHYIERVEVNIGTLSVSDIRVYSNQRVAQLRVTAPGTKSVRCVATLLRKLEDKLPEFIQRNDDKSAGVKKTHNYSKVRKLLKQELGIVPFEIYKQAHSYKIVYTPETIAGLVDPTVTGLDDNAAETLSAGADLLVECLSASEYNSVTEVQINGRYHSVVEVIVYD